LRAGGAVLAPGSVAPGRPLLPAAHRYQALELEAGVAETAARSPCSMGATCSKLELRAWSTPLEQGSLHWSCARELTRVAVPETEEEWLDASRGKTVHQLEALVTGKRPSGKPSSLSRVS
jgi:hypothetical protein